jgi:hypothetical protein
MSYSISLYGHGASVEDVTEVFETAVRALRAATPEANLPISGSASGSGGDGTSFSLSATDVADEPDSADTDEVGEDDPEVIDEPVTTEEA